MAALCSLPQASAVSAEFVQTELKLNNVQLEQVVPHTEYFG